MEKNEFNIIIILFFKKKKHSEEIVRRKDGGKFNKAEYYSNPDAYESTFAERIAPYTSVLVNCLYWDQRYPRLLTTQQVSFFF